MLIRKYELFGINEKELRIYWLNLLIIQMNLSLLEENFALKKMSEKY